MQAGRKRRRRGVIVKDCSVIEGDAPWQTYGQEGASEHELIGFQRGISRIETRIALDRCQRLTTSIMVIRLTFPTPATCMRLMPHRVPTCHGVRLAAGSLSWVVHSASDSGA